MLLNKKILFCVFWLLLVTGSLIVMFIYSNKPGPSVSLMRVPAFTKILQNKGPQLLVFLHPKCSCSEATLSELKSMLPELKELAVTIVFNNPRAQKDWLNGTLWEDARKLNGVNLYIDDDGVETKKFSAQTSGHTVLIDENQTMVFSGGLTASRGHVGMSEGKLFILNWAKQKQGSLISSIFGCNLFKD